MTMTRLHTDVGEAQGDWTSHLGGLVRTFLRASIRRHSIDFSRNGYVFFGILWGLAVDGLIVGPPAVDGDGGLYIASMLGGTLDALPPLVLVPPLLLGWIFGTLGTMEADRRAEQQRTMALLDAEVKHRTVSLRRTYLESVLALAAAIEAKNAYTHGHCNRVWDFARQIAVELEVGPGTLAELEHACYLHDIGKIGLPDAVLDKPGRLTDAEYDQVKEHAALGAEIVGRISGFSRVAKLVRCHHERMDGSGYPDGLCGDEIPLAGRILAVADTLDAMTSVRPYRTAIPMDKALMELLRCAGLPYDPDRVPGRDTAPRNHFDPRVVAALCRALAAEEFCDEDTVIGPPPEGACTHHHGRNCWEIKGCGAERLSPNDPRSCPVPTQRSLDGVNGGRGAGRACWMVPGARCRSEAGGRMPTLCSSCEVVAEVRRDEGELDFQLFPRSQAG